MRWLPLCLALALPSIGAAQPAAVQYRGVYATIDMRPTQEMVRRLSAPHGGERRDAIKEVRNNAGAFTPPVLYALANTLAEDHGEQAIFWYHVGRIRAVYDSLRCRDKSAGAVMQDLRTRISKDLAGAQFYRRERLVAVAEKAVDWDAKNPAKYDHRWAALYGKVAAASPGANADEITVPESEWPAILRHVHETHLKSVREFAAVKPGG